MKPKGTRTRRRRRNSKSFGRKSPTKACNETATKVVLSVKPTPWSRGRLKPTTSGQAKGRRGCAVFSGRYGTPRALCHGQGTGGDRGKPTIGSTASWRRKNALSDRPRLLPSAGAFSGCVFGISQVQQLFTSGVSREIYPIIFPAPVALLPAKVSGANGTFSRKPTLATPPISDTDLGQFLFAGWHSLTLDRDLPALIDTGFSQAQSHHRVRWLAFEW